MRRPSAQRPNCKTVSQWGGFIDDVERVNPAMLALCRRRSGSRSADSPLHRDQSSPPHRPPRSRFAEGPTGGRLRGARAGRYAERIASRQAQRSRCGAETSSRPSYRTCSISRSSLRCSTSACSSSPVISTACQSLHSGDSEMGQCWRRRLLLDEKSYLFLSRARAVAGWTLPHVRRESQRLRAREGVGCVLLKPLAQAIADGDHVRRHRRERD